MSTFGYDSIGRLTILDEPGSGFPTVYYSYDADGELTSVTDELSHITTYTYNNLGERTAVTDSPNGSTLITMSYGYDLNGNETTVTDGLGHVTSYSYDARNRLITATDPSGGGTTTYAYDARGDLYSVTDPSSNTTVYIRDADGRVLTATDPNGHATTYVYNIVGDLTQVTDRDNRVTTFAYDAADRLTGETWVGASPSEIITYTYDSANRITEISDANSNYDYGYDAANQVTSIDDAGTTGLPLVTLTYSYDNNGNRTALDDSLGGLTSYAYDARDQLTTLTQSGSGVASKLVTFGYNAVGEMTAETRYSNLSGTAEVIGTTYSYDQIDRLTGITDTNSSSTVVSSYAYTYDVANRVTQEVRNWTGGGTDTENFSYTNNNQLTQVTHSDSSFSTENYGYDSNGNRNTTGYSTGTGNEQTAAPGHTYTYDNEGNLISDTSGGVTTTYTYDYRNEITSVEVGGTVVATYVYDALDRRIGVTESSATTWTLYDGMSPILDFNGSGTQTARYLVGPTVAGGLGVLARETSGGTVAWYLADRLGTVGDIVNNSGTVIDHIDYDAYGNVLAESNPSNGDRFKYAGMQADAITGLYFDNARWYSPTLGRFISQDPIGFNAGDDNLNRYVFNNPTDYTDPSGLEPMTWWEKYLKWTGTINQAVAIALMDVDGGPKLFGTTRDSFWAMWFADEVYPVDDLRDKFSEAQLVDANNLRYMKNNAARHIYWQAILTMHHDRGTAIIYDCVHERVANPSGGLNDGLVDGINNEIGRRLGERIKKLVGYESMTWMEIDLLLRSLIVQMISLSGGRTGSPGQNDPVLDINDPRMRQASR